MNRRFVVVVTKVLWVCAALVVAFTPFAEAAVSITASDATATESGPTTGTFTLSRGEWATSQTIRIIPSGTATRETDYSVSSTLPISWGTTLPSDTVTGNYIVVMGTTIAAGTITITPVDDASDEGNETVTMTINPSADYTIGTGAASIAIIDNDQKVQFASASSSGAETATPVTMSISLTNPSSLTVTVPYTVSGTATGGGTDYTLANGVLTFTPGQLSKTITATIVNDLKDEDDETLIVTLGAPTNATLGNQTTHTYTIQDDDAVPQVRFSSASSSGLESVTSPGMAVTLSVSSGRTVTVDYSVTGGTATGGGVDYTLVSGTLIFDPGQTTKSIPITVVNDTRDELNETVEVTLSNAANATLGTSVFTYTITDDDATPTVYFTSALSNGPESTATAAFTVRLSAVSNLPVTVKWATVDGTAAAGYDYEAATGTVTIPAGTLTSDPFDVTITNDTADEVNETFTVRLLSVAPDAPVNATLGTPNSLTCTIEDNDGPTVQFELASSSGAEGAAAAIVVTLSAPAPQTVTVAYTTSNGVAGAPADFTAKTGTLTFLAGTTSQTISITTINDLVDEADETFTVTLSSPTNATLGAATTHTWTIVDNDGPTVQISSATSSITEGTGGGATTATVNVTLSAAPAQNVTVAYTTAGGTAVAGLDYTETAGTLTFSADLAETSKTIEVPITRDSDDEVNETFTVTLSNPVNATLGTSKTQTVTITDDDGPTVEFELASSSGSEGTLTASMVVMLSAPSLVPVTVAYSTSPGTAVAPGDYTSKSGTLTFAAGVTSQTISITTINDTTDEADETFTVTLSSPTNATLGDNDTHERTIVDNDNPIVQFTLASSSGSEATSPASIEVKLSASPKEEVTVNYTTANGTALAGSDYTETSGTLTFDAETLTLTQSIEVPIVNDAIKEVAETFTVTLSNSVNATLGTTKTHTRTITDDGDAGNPEVQYALESSSGSEATTTAAIVVKLSAPSALPVTVQYSTSPGTAVAPGDYTSKSGTLTFAAGITSQTISITTTNDTTDEADETFTVTLSNPTNATLGNITAHMRTIVDNDSPTVQFESVSSSGSEGASPAVIAVILSAASVQNVTVNYTTANGATTPAVAGADYTATSGTLTFTAGETRKTIEVPITNDSYNEVNELFTVTLSNPVNAVLGTTKTHTRTIVDNDGPTLQFELASSSGPEATTPAALKVKLSRPSLVPVTVQYATFNGTATAGSDYTATTGTLTFAAKTTSQTINVPVTNDTADEEDENFTVTLWNPTNASLGSRTTHTRTIVDNDGPTVQFELVSSSGSEASTPATIVVKLSAPSAQDVTVSYATANGATTPAVAGSDYTAKSDTVEFAAGETSKTITVSITNDTADEVNELFTVTLSNPVNAALGTTKTHTRTILDNDGPEVQFELASSTGSEATTTAALKVTLSAPSPQPITVQYATSNGTAIAGPDYTAKSGTLTFAAKSTSQTISIPIINDLSDEPDETFTVTLSNPTNATLGATTTHTRTIVDNNDTGGPTVQFELASSSGSEDSTPAAIVVKLSAPSGQIVTVNYATANGATTPATAGSDYTATSGTLTFNPGDTSKTIDVPITGDGDDEQNEIFTVTLSTPVNATLGTVKIHTRTIVDNDGPTVQFALGSASGPESTTTVAMTVTLSAASVQPVTVLYATSDETATAGSDYTAKTGTLTFGAGVMSQTISISVTNDTSDETDESFTVTLSNPTNATLGVNDAHERTILDNDGPTAQFELAASSGGEGTNAAMVVILSAVSVQDVSVNYSTASGTAATAATANSDYTAASSATLVIPAGETSGAIEVPVLVDAVHENDETFTVTLSTPTNATLGTRTVHTRTITDKKGTYLFVSQSAGFDTNMIFVEGIAGTLTVGATGTFNLSVVDDTFELTYDFDSLARANSTLTSTGTASISSDGTAVLTCSTGFCVSNPVLFSVSANGQLILTGNPASPGDLDSSQVVGIKTGTGKGLASLDGTYRVSNQEIGFIKDGTASYMGAGSGTIEFDGDGGCTVVGGLDHFVMDDAANSIGSDSVSYDEGTVCTYTVSYDGSTTVTIDGNAMNLRLGDDDRALVSTTNLINGIETGDDTIHIPQFLMIKQGTGMDVSALSGTYKFVSQRFRYEDNADVLTSKAGGFAGHMIFDGNGNCITFDNNGGHNSLNLSSGNTDSDVSSPNNGFPCTYTVNGTGYVTITSDDSDTPDSGWVGEGGQGFISSDDSDDSPASVTSWQTVMIKTAELAPSSSMSGTFNGVGQDIEFSYEDETPGNPTYTGVIGQSNSLTCDGTGDITDYSYDEYEFKMFDESNTITDPSPPPVAGLTGSYLITGDGRLWMDFGLDGTGIAWLGMDGVTVIGGDAASDSSSGADLSRWISVKQGSSMNNASLQGTFKFTTMEKGFFYYEAGTKAAHDVYGNSVTMSFNGAGVCTLVAWSGAGIEMIPETSSITVTNDSQGIVSCAYSVQSNGDTTITLDGTPYADYKLSSNGRMLLRNSYTDQGGRYSVSLLVGVKMGTTMSVASLKGVYQIVVQDTGFEYDSLTDRTYSTAHNYSGKILFNGAGKCVLTDFQGHAFGMSHIDDFVDYYPYDQNGSNIPCTYTVSATGSAVVTWSGPMTGTQSGWVSSDGNTLLFGGPDMGDGQAVAGQFIGIRTTDK